MGRHCILRGPTFMSMELPRLIVLILTLAISLVNAINVCAGEGARYGDFKCNHDATHRVCAKLKSGSSKVMWGGQNFWQLTGQPDWSSNVGTAAANPGGDWCICMWATASLIQKVGCANVHIDCSATDVTYVMGKYRDGSQDLSAAKECLTQKCGASRSNAMEQVQLGVSLDAAGHWQVH